MASVPQPEADTGFARCDEFVDYQVQAVRRRIRSTDLLTAGILTGLVLASYVLIFTLLDHWVISGGFGTRTRAVMLGLVVVACGAIAWRWVIRPWRRQVHPLYAARQIDRASGTLRGALLSLVDLKSSAKPAGSALVKTLEKRAAVRLAEMNVDDSIDRRLLLRLAAALLIVVVLLCLYAVFSPKAIALLRPLSLSPAAVATQTRILAVQPGNVTVAAGSHLEFIVDVAGAEPDSVEVAWTTADRRYVDERLTLRPTDDEGRWQVIFVGEQDRGVRQRLTYSVIAGDARSEEFVVEVRQPPTAHVTQVDYAFPAYMNLPDRSDTRGAIDAWENTIITIHAEASGDITDGVLQFADDETFAARAEEIPMERDGRSLTATFTLTQRSDGTFPSHYRVQLTDPQGDRDPDPTVYPIQARIDQPPVVRLIDPSRDLEVPANGVVPLLIEAEDPDFLLRSVTLHRDVNGTPVQPDEFIYDAVSDEPRQRFLGAWEFRMESLDVRPGDVIRYQVAARDNKPPLGSQSRTGELRIRITEAVDEDVVEQQLRQDRRVQEQLTRERQPGSAGEAPPAEPQDSGAQEPEDSGAAPESGSEGSPTPDGATPGDDSSSEARPDGQSPATGERTDGDSNRGDPSPSESGNSQTGDNAEERVQPGSEPGGSESSQPPAGDDEALQRLIEHYRDQSDGASESPPAAGEQPSVESPPSATPPDGASPPTPGQPTPGPPTPPTTPPLDPTRSPDPTPGEPGRPDTDTAAGDAAPDTPRDQPQQGQPGAGQPGQEQPGQEQPGADPPGQEQPGTEQPSQQQPSRDQPGAERPGPEQPSQEQPSQEQPSQEQPSQEQPGSQQTGDQQSGGEQPSGQQSGGQQSSGQQSSGQQAGDQQSGGQQSSSQQSGGSQPGGQQSGDGQSGGQQSGSQQSGGRQAGGQQSGSQQSGGSQSGGEQSGGGQSGGQQSGSQQSGGGESGGEQSGGEQSGSQQSSGEQAGGEPSGSQQPDGQQSGGEQSGGQQSGSQQSGGEQSGSQQSGGEQTGSQQSGGQQSGSEQTGGQQSGGQQGGGQQGGGQQGGGQQGGGQQGGGQQGGGQQGGGQQGGGQQGGRGADSAPTGGQGGSGQGGASGASGGGNSAIGSNAWTQGAGGAPDPDAPQNESGSGPDGGDAAPPPDPDVEQAARAADLTIRRLSKELERGNVDRELLDDLGWTEDQLRSFAEKMKEQLSEREATARQQREKGLSQKSFEELLRSLDLDASGRTRTGRTDRNRELQDTTIRRSEPPGRYREWQKMYERALSDPQRPASPPAPRR